MSQELIYHCSPSIIWARDAHQTVVVDKESGRSWALRGVEAVVWSLLTVDYSYQRIVPLLSLILSLSVEDAQRTLAGVLCKWQDANIVQVLEEADGCESSDQ